MLGLERRRLGALTGLRIAGGVLVVGRLSQGLLRWLGGLLEVLLVLVVPYSHHDRVQPPEWVFQRGWGLGFGVCRCKATKSGGGELEIAFSALVAGSASSPRPIVFQWLQSGGNAMG